MKAKLAKILACPYCKNKVSNSNELELVCKRCEATFVIEEGIPLMVDTGQRENLQAEINATESGSRMKRDFLRKFTIMDRIRKILAPPQAFLKRDIKDKIDILLNHAGDETIVVNIGSGSGDFYKEVIHLDIYPFPNVDVIGDAHKLPFANESVDSVVIVAVLEHLRKPQLVLKEINRVLKKGGYVYIDVPFLAHYHGYPNDFQRYTLTGLEELCSCFTRVESGVVVGPSSAVSELLRVYVTLFSKRFYIQKFLQALIGWLTFPLKYLDKILIKNKNSHIAAYANFFFGQKVDPEVTKDESS